MEVRPKRKSIWDNFTPDTQVFIDQLMESMGGDVRLSVTKQQGDTGATRAMLYRTERFNVEYARTQKFSASYGHSKELDAAFEEWPRLDLFNIEAATYEVWSNSGLVPERLDFGEMVSEWKVEHLPVADWLEPEWK